MNDLFEFIYNATGEDYEFYAFKDTKGTIWLEANGIYDILGYARGRNITNVKLTSEHKKYYGQLRNDGELRKNAVFISEAGFYLIVFSSEMPEAKAFKKWLAEEVIPTLRKTGTYTINEKDANKVIEIVEKTLTRKDKSLKSATQKLSTKTYVPGQAVYAHEYSTYARKTGKRMYKLGHAKYYLGDRKPAYGTGHTNSGTFVYHRACFNSKLMEAVLLHRLQYYLYDENKEMIDIDLNKLIDVIDETVDFVDGKILKGNVEQIIQDSDSESELTKSMINEVKNVFKKK